MIDSDQKKVPLVIEGAKIEIHLVGLVKAMMILKVRGVPREKAIDELNRWFKVEINQVQAKIALDQVYPLTHH